MEKKSVSRSNLGRKSRTRTEKPELVRRMEVDSQIHQRPSMFRVAVMGGALYALGYAPAQDVPGTAEVPRIRNSDVPHSSSVDRPCFGRRGLLHRELDDTSGEARC
eukprot:CAMPEP_0170171336 /NCGR_PEP_ID=MMETSP0040_2-20121228/4461_1 /TAXON_ID=641309 /ORGANISM="Lotharella oceanica, Strain CCMP622" /LENGTH=105 /DNA_ID=CAMNT_0010411319 /DNA_START=29 /DNA_END=345 /DNA_ORIENTATION=-